MISVTCKPISAFTLAILVMSSDGVRTDDPAVFFPSSPERENINNNNDNNKESILPEHYLAVSVMNESPQDHKYKLWNIVQNHLESMTPEKKAGVWEEMNARIEQEKANEGVWWRLSPWKPAHKRCYRDVMRELKSGCETMSFEWFKDTVDKLSSCVIMEKNGCASENLMISALYVFQLPLLCLQSTQDDIKSLQKEMTVILEEELKIAREELSNQSGSLHKRDDEFKQIEMDMVECEKNIDTANAQLSAAQREVELARKDLEHYLKDIDSKIDIIEFQKKTISSKEDSNAHLHQLYIELQKNYEIDKAYARGRWGCVSDVSLISYNGRQPWMCKFLPLVKRHAGPFGKGIDFVNEICLHDGIPNFIRDGLMLTIISTIVFSMFMGCNSVLRKYLAAGSGTR